MTTTINKPVYRMTVYDRDDTTVLVPTGSIHSQPFQISTGNVAGYLPYMDYPRGSMSYTTLPQSSLTAGRLVVNVLDQRTTQGGSNLQRWMTAFISDENNRLQLFGRLCNIEQSLDGGSSWTDFFVGRITNTTLANGLQYQIEITDSFADLQNEIFDFLPHLSYVVAERLIPSGLDSQVLSMAPGYSNTPVLGCKVTAMGNSTVPGVLFEVETAEFVNLSFPPDHMSDEFTSGITATQFQALDVLGATFNIPLYPETNPNKNVRVRLYSFDTQALLGELVLYLYESGTDVNNVPFLQRFIAWTDGTDPDGLDISTFHVNDKFYFDITGPTNPFYLNQVHPLDLVADMCAGHYTLTGTNGNAITIGLDTDSITALKASRKDIHPGIYRITQPMKIQDVIEKWVCQPYGLGYCTVPKDGQSVLTFFDLALPSASLLPSLPTLGADDFDATYTPQWTALPPIKTFTYTYYSDYYDPMPTVAADQQYPKTLSVTNEVLTTQLTDVNLPASTYAIDANGVRGGIAVSGSNSTAGPQYDFKIEPYALTQAQNIANRFVIPGSSVARVQCRRTSTVQGLSIGDWVLTTIDKQPNQATKQRGGTRLMQVTGYDDAQGATVLLTLTDGGLNVVAPAPTLGTFQETTASLGATVQLPITLASAYGAVTFQVVQAQLGESLPNETDTRWRTVGQPIILNHSTQTAFGVSAGAKFPIIAG